ncbi:TPA: pilus protein [Escherichia coli]|nr:pilus protein [Escherichia coli]
MPGCQERRPRRDRGGAAVPVAASRGFASGMEARQGGDSSAGSVHDSPPRQGDAQERHRQENNKTDSNQSSRKKKNSSRNKNIPGNRRITGMKRQRLTSERPRNGRGGA